MRGCRCSMIMGFTKPIEHFNLQRKKVITMNTLYVGIDVSSKSNVVYLMLPNGNKHSNFSVANSHKGSTQLVKRILSALTSHSLDTVIIGLEATSVYGDNLVYFLREDATLAYSVRTAHPFRRNGAPFRFKRNRQIMMRSDIKLPQPFASWSNSL